MKKPTADALITWSTEARKIDDLVPFAQNPRKMTEDQVAQLTRSIEQFGFAEIPAINRDGQILAGHQRCRVMQLLGRGQEETDVRVPSRLLTPEEAKTYNVRSNKTTGEWDFDLLAGLFDESELRDIGFSEAELGLLDFGEEPDGSEDEAPEPPETPRSAPGDLYELGPHRLLCGDSLDLESLRRLMGGKKASMVFTDPPWNVDYTGKGKGAMKIDNDSMGVKEWGDFCTGIADSLAVAAAAGAPTYVVMSAQEWPVIDAALRAAGFHWSSTIIWAKDTLVLSRKDYHAQYEPIWYGWEGSAARLVELADRKQSDLWQVDRPTKSDLHPTTKPVALVERAIKNSSIPGDVVLDLFLGSGTTLIAADRVGRACWGAELDPKYADVIVERYCQHAGARDVVRNGEKVRWEPPEA